MKFPDELLEGLRSYVYIYIDPRDNQAFYIGKGTGDRAFHHLEANDASAKAARIQAIRADGQEPKIDLLRYGMSDGEASLVEAAAIDLIGIPPLLNVCHGHHNGTFPRVSCADLIAAHQATPAKIRHKSILITINRLYRTGMTKLELEEATRGIWKVGAKREEADLAMAVFRGIIREVYVIGRWHPAGTLEYKTRDDITPHLCKGRWEFEASLADERIRTDFIGKSVRHILGPNNQNPIRYVDPDSPED